VLTELHPWAAQVVPPVKICSPPDHHLRERAATLNAVSLMLLVLLIQMLLWS
jgi:hypothetical protein